ncbi:peptidase S8 and S53, subtilisin, kexin, sedolisin [Thermococcus sp. 2319x1]|uniref:S8 family peptidase n=1 Tax=Thermococcus sp. 2319x1 TaxID=1674923 RepID=UPI00073A5DFD|nr:S8 family peptidase [Thermococcus sp. 2319x1]ALV63486.1 peptidase S8 and S53, subtilisin, kexin, sedolisin [Thermococcus sp. 2319x1]
MRRAATILIAMLVLFSPLVMAVSYDTPQDRDVVRVIVGVRESAGKNVVGMSEIEGEKNKDPMAEFMIYTAQLKGYGKLKKEIPEIGVIVLEVPRKALEKIKGLPFVTYVEEDVKYHALGEVQWDVQYIYAPNVWNNYYKTYGYAAYGYHPSIQIAVLDTGVDYTHPDLQGAFSWCVRVLNNGGSYYKGTDLRYCWDDNGHGTHVAGTIGASLNGQGIAGVAPYVQMYVVKVLDSRGSGYLSDIAQGIIEATKGPDGIPGTADDADVISMSLGGSKSTTLYNAVRYAYSYGVVLVAASGNEGAPYPSYPAAYSEVIAVGAIDSNYRIASFSNRRPDVVAPGVNVYSTLPGGTYGTMSGTSMACPHVSGVVALMQALRVAAGKPKLTPYQVRNILISTAIDLGSRGYDVYYGYGLVDAEYAVYYALNS